MTRDLDPNDLQGEWSSVGPEHWTDYDRAMPYGDFDVTLDPNDAPVESEQMRYLEGFGLPAQQTVSTSATEYLHGDLIRSTMLTTGQGGTAVSAVSYTAFGEAIGTAADTRYQYAGGWGYETAGFGDDPGLLVLNGAEGTAPITLQHVGFRWYQPDIGRFIQRDPVGIAGGLNVYGYMLANPLSGADPLGLESPKEKLIRQLIKNLAEAFRLKGIMDKWGRMGWWARMAWRLRYGRWLMLRWRTWLRLRFGRWSPWVVLAICIHYDIVEPALDAADDWNKRTRGIPGLINTRRIGSRGLFGPRESDELWQLVTY